MNLPKQLLLILSATAVACSAGTQEAGPRGKLAVRFFVPSLIPNAEWDATPDSVWSSNDDRDSIYVILVGAPKETIASILVEGRVERILSPDLESMIPDSEADPHRISILRQEGVNLDAAPNAHTGRLLLILRPSSIDQTAQRSGLISPGEIITRLMVVVRLSTGQEAKGGLLMLFAI